MNNCTAKCWEPAKCPTCGNDVGPRGHSVPLEWHESKCCEEFRQSMANPRHAWDQAEARAYDG